MRSGFDERDVWKVGTIMELGLGRVKDYVYIWLIAFEFKYFQTLLDAGINLISFDHLLTNWDP